MQPYEQVYIARNWGLLPIVSINLSIIRAILEADSSSPVKLSDDYSLANTMTAVSWETLNQNQSPKLLPRFVSTETTS